MLVSYIAKMTDVKKSMRSRPGPVFLPLIAAAMLSGCMGTSFDLFDGSPKVDRSIATNTIARGNKPIDARSDEATIQNAVTSADLGKLGKGPLPWANATTGSAGIVTAIREQKSDGLICRRFATTRHSYEGIAKFEGRTCVAGSGDWQLLSFDRQQ